MRRKPIPLTAWLLGGIAACLLLAEIRRLSSAHTGGSFELLWGGLTLVMAAGLSASADARWSE